jgi:hypothetical protein
MADLRVIRKIASINGLETRLTNIETSVTDEETRATGVEGSLTALTSAVKTSLVAAINSNKSVTDTTVSNLDGAAAKKASNLSDLTDVAAARSNIQVYSKTEVDTAITNAKVALGTNYFVADNAARNAITDLTINDIVTVNNSGSWVKYGVDSLSPLSFYVITSKEIYERTYTADALKSTLDAVADTNFLTDSEQTKIGHISITSARDLDKLVQSDELVTDMLAAGFTDSDIEIPSTSAIVDYVTESVRVGGAVDETELLTVATGGVITLAHAPKFGRKSIMNFQCVRLIEVENGVTVYTDAGVSAVSGQSKQFKVNVGDNENLWDGKQVYVQYQYTAEA